MTIIQAIVLGIIQGITEFLPISSSGHLIFLPQIFGWSDQGQAFDAVVHVGTLVAVVIYFREKLLSVIKNFFSKTGDPIQKRLGWYLIFSIFPAAIFGFVISEVLEVELRSPTLIAINFIVWGVLLLAADRYAKKQGSKNLETIDKKSVFFMSFAQALALLPGTSRSGITMTAGLFSKLDKKSAAEFSFLMSIPIIAMAGTLKVVELIQEGVGNLTIDVLLVGFFVSALSGFAAIAGLLKIIQKWSFLPFVVYRIVMGVLILMFL